jgi:aarF domain-containing kinase
MHMLAKRILYRRVAKGFSLRHLSSLPKQNQTSGNSNSGGLKYSILGGLAITAVGGTKLLQDEVGGTEGLQRTLSFYSLAIPSYVTYRAYMAMGLPDEEWDELDRKTSKKGLEKIMSLGGFYVKSGQMAANNIGNAFPKIWQNTMSVLQDECPAKSFDVVKEIIEAEYGRPMEEVFAEFDELPLGAASIGQVHKATLQNGESVVVKVMYPEVENIFRGDVRTIKMFCSVAQPVHVPPLNEVEKQFMTEFDYVQEAKQMDKIRINLEKAGLAGHRKLALVPKPYMGLCTKRVLVMEELKGEKLPTALLRDAERHAAKVGMSVAEFQANESKKVRELKRKGESAQGPNEKEYDIYIKAMDGKRRASNLFAIIHNFTYGILPGVQRKSYLTTDILPINHAKLIDDLVLLHGHEVLVDGYFNGDPHPGNILLLGAKGGKKQLGLIDYGQVKSLTTEERLHMCKLIIALAEDNKNEIVKLMKEAGFQSKTMKEDVIYKYARVSYDEDNDELTEGMHIQLYMEELQRQDPIEQLPDQYIMVGRISVMLRGFAHALRQSRSIAKAWKPIAEKVLKEEMK